MKYLYYILFISLFAACNTKEDAEQCNQKKYGEEFSIKLGESICFPDGNSFEVKVISDEFCCCLCLCTWEGELEIMIETTDPSGQKDLLSFGSSTYNLKNNIFEGFIVSKIGYLYKNEANSLPVCGGEYDAKEVELTFIISPK